MTWSSLVNLMHGDLKASKGLPTKRFHSVQAEVTRSSVSAWAIWLFGTGVEVVVVSSRTACSDVSRES